LYFIEQEYTFTVNCETAETAGNCVEAISTSITNTLPPRES